MLLHGKCLEEGCWVQGLLAHILGGGVGGATQAFIKTVYTKRQHIPVWSVEGSTWGGGMLPKV